MKNIYLIPTDKPSRLIIYSTLLNEFRLLNEPIEDWKHKRHIYITSDKEIKEGDWYCSPSGITSKHNGSEKLPNNWKKIILTTDQDLIKDGVQAIDDTFLEWLVRNPSCEFAKVESWTIDKEWDSVYRHFNPIHPHKTKYKIIIPKEEPKFKNRQIGAAGFVANKIMENMINKAKQETLEEAAKNCLKENNLSTKGDFAEGYILGAIMGAEWQQERMYSEEDLKAAWIHGAIRSPEEFKHLNNFDVWLEHFKKKQ